MPDRRHTDRRLPPGTCAICRHVQGDHHEGTGACLDVGCACLAYTAQRQVVQKSTPKTRARARVRLRVVHTSKVKHK